MDQSRLERLAPMSGVVFFGLVLLAALLFNNYSFLPDAEEVHTFFTEGSTRVGWAGYVGVVSAVFLIWFAGSVRASMRPAEGGTGRLSAVAFGGGVGAGVLVALGYSLIGGAAIRAGAEGGIGVESATTIFDLYSMILGGAVPVALAGLIGAAAVVAFRTRVWPAWLAWTSAILAIGSISPYSFVFVGLDFLWILVVSIWLYARTRAPAAAA